MTHFCCLLKKQVSMMTIPRLNPVLPVPMDEKKLVAVIEKAKDWALMHGAGMRSKKEFNKDALQFAPFSFLPSPFPRAEFEKAVNLQVILNELMHKVAHDDQFLEETLTNTLQVDEFTAGLYSIWKEVKKEGVAQTSSLGLFRSDYMLQLSELSRLKQVEFNTVASSFGGISTQLSHSYSFILQQLGHGDMVQNMPQNNALSGLCNGIIDAFDLYGAPTAIVLFVIEDVSYNICDQRFHEFHINKVRPDITVVRKTLTEVYNEAVLDKNKHIVIDGRQVAVVYYRSGYEPAQYHGDKEWTARLRLEKSMAIKCPSIQYHLAGTKKVQQALAESGAVERFIQDQDKVGQIRDIFTGLYSLDFDDNGEKAVEMAINEAERFVLKPQREGGGNNIYGAEIRKKLQKIRQSPERASYILMEKITPPLVKGYIVRPGAEVPPPVVDIVSELGIFGVIIGTKDSILMNKQVGHMLRSKCADANEGGVASGLGALDSPYLVEL